MSINSSNNAGRVMSRLNIQTVVFAAYDMFTIAISFFVALFLRFDCSFNSIPVDFLETYYKSIAIHILLSIIVYSFAKLYNSVWRFAGYYELIRMVVTNIILAFIYAIFNFVFIQRMPVSYYVFGIIFQFISGIFLRFGFRTILLIRGHSRSDTVFVKPVLIVGAGDAGRIVCKDINNTSRHSEKVIAFIDDDSDKWNRVIDGIEVVGGRESIQDVVQKNNIQKIYVAIPSAPKSEIKAILNICTETNCEVYNLPSIYELANNKVNLSLMREVAIEDLLGREPIRVNDEQIGRFIEGKVVLITGAGGSIGSELSRQVASNNPRKLILLDVYENSVYDVQLALRRRYPNLDLEVLIGSVRDSRRVFQIFEKYRPQIVYHAAAHKHVPLMEMSPCEAIKNNTIGTYKTAFAAMVHGCERFVLISTDKAVNPTNVMGASKRMCEMIIQAFDQKIKSGTAHELPQLFTHWLEDDIHLEDKKESLRNAKTEFVAVRFGNVLGSNGSVIPIFKRQIEQGGPVTVTHPDIIRYFMTIPEAVSLVLQAGTYANGGEIFVLDMGEPMKIDTLARNLIKLSGYIPDEDIKIEYTGLRPGEKLYEEKLMAEEGLTKTENDLIHVGSPIPFNTEDFLQDLDSIMRLAYKNKETIREDVAKIVTTFHVN